MATYDNKHWLLSHIRNSFISTDDTGMCEIVMLGENFPKQLLEKSGIQNAKLRSKAEPEPNENVEFGKERVTEYDPYPEMEESDEDDPDLLATSYDIQCEMDFVMYRQRSNTAQRLEKMDQALKKAAKIKVVKWENPPNQLTNEERSQLFTRKDLTKHKKVNTGIDLKIKSLLSDQLEKCPSLPHIQYIEYAKYDGTAQLGLPTKTFKIFMTMLPENQRNYPITVCIVASAKIQDLLGFICYKYSIVHPNTTLGPANSYGLFMIEEDGEIDWTFPALDTNEPCSKFGLPCLGLVDLKSCNTNMKQSEVACSINERIVLNDVITADDFKPDIGHRSRSATFDSKDKLNVSNVKVAGNLKNEKLLKPSQKNNTVKFSEDQTKTRGVVFDRMPRIGKTGEASSEPSNGATILNKSPQNSPTSHQMEAMARFRGYKLAIEAPLFQSFEVQLCNRVRSNTGVLLSISGDKIEMDPLHGGSHKFWSKTKPVTYNMDAVAWCELVESRTNRAIFRLVYSTTQNDGIGQRQHGFLQSTPSFKHHDFECDQPTAKEIVEKINRILALRMSDCRREYKAAKDRKLQTRRSFHMPKHS